MQQNVLLVGLDVVIGKEEVVFCHTGVAVAGVVVVGTCAVLEGNSGANGDLVVAPVVGKSLRINSFLLVFDSHL